MCQVAAGWVPSAVNFRSSLKLESLIHFTAVVIISVFCLRLNEVLGGVTRRGQKRGSSRTGHFLLAL